MEWNHFTEYKLWGLVAMGVLAFIAGCMGLLNGQEEAAPTDTEAVPPPR